MKTDKRTFAENIMEHPACVDGKTALGRGLCWACHGHAEWILEAAANALEEGNHHRAAADIRQYAKNMEF